MDISEKKVEISTINLQKGFHWVREWSSQPRHKTSSSLFLWPRNKGFLLYMIGAYVPRARYYKPRRQNSIEYPFSHGSSWRSEGCYSKFIIKKSTNPHSSPAQLIRISFSRLPNREREKKNKYRFYYYSLFLHLGLSASFLY